MIHTTFVKAGSRNREAGNRESTIRDCDGSIIVEAKSTNDVIFTDWVNGLSQGSSM